MNQTLVNFYTEYTPLIALWQDSHAKRSNLRDLLSLQYLHNDVHAAGPCNCRNTHRLEEFMGNNNTSPWNKVGRNSAYFALQSSLAERFSCLRNWKTFFRDHIPLWRPLKRTALSWPRKRAAILTNLGRNQRRLTLGKSLVFGPHSLSNLELVIC